jgi:hypothetical protein
MVVMRVLVAGLEEREVSHVGTKPELGGDLT